MKQVIWRLITVLLLVAALAVGAGFLFEGSVAQWNAISFGISWDENTGAYTVYCSDGEIVK